MTVTSTSEDIVNQSFYTKSRNSLQFTLNKDADFYLSLGRIGRGAQHLGRKERIKEVYFNKQDNWLYAGFLSKNRDGYSYKYVQLIQVHSAKEKDV
jgi:hypothetical protein